MLRFGKVWVLTGMKLTIQWNSAEDANAICHSFGKEVCRFQVYEVDEDEAELSLELPEETSKIDRKIILKVTKAIKKLCRELRKDGYFSFSMSADGGSFTDSFLNRIECSTNVVKKNYSEYMLKKSLENQQNSTVAAKGAVRDGQNAEMEPEKTVSRNLAILQLENESRYVWNGEEDLFSCRVKPYRDGYYIYEVAVREDRRNQGIGTAAMQELLQRKELSGCLYLQVGSYNERALHIYRKLGFETDAERCYYKITGV